ncbi:MAG: FAD binding domain-containing protein [Tenericutes bacterium]|nr:FAD binding domain-containing protein [Mycoplasmatota bacterium]
MVKAIVPSTLKEVLLNLSEEKYRLVAGGTDMLIQFHNHSPLPIAFKDNIMYIADIEELQGIYDDDKKVYIGACEPLESLLKNVAVPKILQDTIIEMASPAIRNTATLGGNIGNASPAGDSLVPLYLLNADIEIQSINNSRIVCIRDFIKGVRKIDLKQNELITKIILDKPSFTKTSFKKVGPRRSDAISKLSFAGAVTLENDLVKDFRIAFGSVNITVVRRPEIENKYINISVNELKDSVNKIVEDYSDYIRPIDDQRSNKEYRKHVCKNILREFILSI